MLETLAMFSNVQPQLQPHPSRQGVSDGCETRGELDVLTDGPATQVLRDKTASEF